MELMEWIVVFFSVGMVNFIIAMLGVHRFVSQYPAIRTSMDLDAFKQMVRRQMVQTLVQIVLLAGMELPGVIGIAMKKLSFNEFLLFLGLNGIIILVGLYGKVLEKKAKSLEVEDEALQPDYQHVCESWVKKPFPDF
jgi:hypothetical protein